MEDNSNSGGGAQMWVTGKTNNQLFQCSKTELIYLSGSLHIIDVVAKSSDMQTNDGIVVYEGRLTIKLTQYNEGADINLSLINTS
ncbi:unnamed protein product [Didymodactylos carnosus]|uniref:Uncharacterized protein n=1 Tax=Didymodactylos carnosus TaxID=1234261 RepID=A0A8S2WWB2_9BILA|nr:unnamed protein product [Didymodactylos carnosus]CAF4464208.1 unnamed protein product [Didymodactylos carnosus]